jgi:molybdopterin-guanine dinucleotide biosynthesis protein A
VFSLCKRTVLPSLTAYLAQGGRKVSAWQKQQAYVEVDFSDQAEAFVNLNTLHELDALALKLNHE